MGAQQDTQVLGLLIDETLPVPGPGPRGALVDVNITPSELRTVQRLSRLANTATGAHDKMVMDEFSHLVVRLPAGGYGTTEFDMSDGRRNALVDAGREAMRAYFDQPPVAHAAPRSAGRSRSGPGQRYADRIAARLLGT
jgi:hypothetical protein